MNYIVAVSGGVDSVVLLDMLVREGSHSMVVAHFDHGIRQDSARDALFVQTLAKRYGLPCVTRREELGKNASEALARERRYLFLQEVAGAHNARIVTAHHLDDLVETVAINVTRGTGWRGLAPFHSAVIRPLIDTTKEAIRTYALQNSLVWREDSTNSTDAYLRNRLRRKTLNASEDTKRQLRALHVEQRRLRREIDAEARRLVGAGPAYSRYSFSHMGDRAALACLWTIFDGALTRPQLARVLRAIKTAKAGTQYECGGGKTIQFSTRQFTV